MHIVDWAIVGLYLVWIIYDGLKRTKGSDRIEGYFLANRSLPWWAVGLSVMATQLSAITIVGTTGQGYADGMSFVQFYFGLPIAMIILSLTVVPFFHRAKVYTAYEYLEKRFDAKTRALAASLFLVLRALSCGTIISAPAIILSIVLGWNLTATVAAIGLPTVLYTMFGGVQAVTWTDVKQIAVVIAGMLAAVVVLVVGISHHVGVSEALHLAGATGRMQSLDFHFNLRDTYTFWSGTIGGLFLMLSYFGCDQSQVQRYLTAKSVQEGRESLMVSAFAKIPLQALVLLTGVLVFVFYLFQTPPLLFNPVHEDQIRRSAQAGAYHDLETEFARNVSARRTAALAAAAARDRGDAARAHDAEQAFLAADARVRTARQQAVGILKQATGDQEYTDVNYVFPTFVVTSMPIGLVGLMIAAIFAAAMSASAGELNSLATTSVIDIYRRHVNTSASDRHYLLVSKLATGVWGLFACVVAVYAVNLGSLIEVVNKFGSYFYGSLLGVFVLAIGTKRATGRGAFWGLIMGMLAVGAVGFGTDVSYLWYNVVGVVVVTVVGMVLSYTDRAPAPTAAT
ncbi:MAG TPA: sodium:solute symporter [Vicinamibacterales bacterium]|nr:sodium:solute symporter [Vicinamibacterales bacterium]